MEMDPNSGFMWIIDNGRVDFLDNTPAKNNCPPKLIIYDVEENTEVHRYTFPEKVANSTSCFLNDIVLDYIDGQVKFAYISDPSDAKLYVYDYEGDSSYFFQDPSMTPTNPGAFSAINGIAMSAHFDFLYYCPVDGFGLFQVPTTILHNADSDFSQAVRHVGTRPGRSGGLAYGQRNLYYGLLDTNGVNVWHVAHDAQQTGYDHVVMLTQEPLVRDQIKMHWVDSFAWDDSGHLWFTVNNLNKFMDRTMDFSGGSGPNIYVWKIQVNETSYLKQTPLTCLPVG